MKPGDKVRIEIPKSKSMETLEKQGVAAVRLILKSSAIMELEGKKLQFVLFVPDSNFAIIKTLGGKEYEVHKRFLKEIK